MKIQHLAVIFVIIILPISIVFASYVDSQVETLLIENQYDTRLLNCTYDAIKAYQLNTVNNTESDVTNSKIADIEASVNTFKNSLVTSFGYTGYDLSVMDEYVPALVYTLYDGYYIYQPYENTLTETYVYTDSNLKEGTRNGLKSYVYYSCRYQPAGTSDDFVITYTLDNSITIQGTINGEFINESGYLIDGITKGNDSGRIYFEYDGIKYYNKKFSPSDPEFSDPTKIGTESLEEYIGSKKYPYIKLNGTKYYLDETNKKIFSILNGTITTQMSETINDEEYKVYKALIETNNSAYNYFAKAYVFTKLVREDKTTVVYQEKDSAGNNIDKHGLGLSSLSPVDAIDETTGSKTNKYGNYKIFQEVSGKYIQDSDSNFNQMRRDVIRNSIETNLKTAIAGFTAYSNVSTDFAMPKISESDWDLIENNVTAISFMQGMKIKGKTYNGYAVVPNSLTKEYVPEESIYITTDVTGSLDSYEYHKANDTDLISDANLNNSLTKSSGFLNLDFERRAITEGEYLKYYYPRSPSENNIYSGCYKSIVSNSSVANINNIDMNRYIRELDNLDSKNIKLKATYYTALARERESTFKIYNDELINQVVIIYHANGATSGEPPESVLINKKTFYDVAAKPTSLVLLDDDTGEYKNFKGWDTKSDGTGTHYDEHSSLYARNSCTLYAQWEDAYYYVKYEFGLQSGEVLKDESDHVITGIPKVIKPVGTYTNLYENSLTKTKSDGTMYEVLGWSKTEDGEIDYNLGEEYKDSKKITLYPVWGKIAEIASIKWNYYTQWSSAIQWMKEDGTADTTGKNIYMTGNTTYQGLNCMWARLSNPIRKVSLSYGIDFQHSYISAGIMLITKDESNKISGYTFSFYNSGSNTSIKTFNEYEYTVGSLVSGNQPITPTNIDFESRLSLKQSINLDSGYISYYHYTKKPLEILINDRDILIKGESGGVSTPYPYDDFLNPGEKIYSIGFYSTHQSHGCGNIGKFLLNNIKVITKE